MKTANEMRKMTDSKLEELKQQRIENATAYVENVLAPTIESKASCGKDFMHYTVPADISTLYVVRYLRSLGYVATTTTIGW